MKYAFLMAAAVVVAAGVATAAVPAAGAGGAAPGAIAPQPGARTFDVRAYGATGDGKTLDTAAIAAALDAAEKAGGGTVTFPAGTYASFSVRLRSNVSLHLAEGAVLLAATPPREGPGARGGFGGGGRGNGGGGRGGNGAGGGNGGGGGAGAARGAIGQGGGAIYSGDNFGASDPTTLPAPRAGGRGAGGGQGRGQGRGAGGGQGGGQGRGRAGGGQAQAAASQPAATGPAPAGYDPAEPNEFDAYQDFGHSHWHNSLLWGENLKHVTISGPGRIDGQGLSRSASERNPTGNKIFGLKNCDDVTIRDVTLYRGGHFALLATGVDHLTLDHVTVDTDRDGFDIDACQHVTITNCTLNSPNDDALVLKSSYALGVARPCDDITIKNCHVSGFDEGTLLDGTKQTTQRTAPDRGGVTGRIKFGTESNGGFKNITISDCTFEHCRGLAIESVDGGPIENITVNNLTMNDVTSAPLFVRLGNRARGPEGTPVATVKHIVISNVTATLADPRYGSLFSGIPGHSIEDLTLSHLRLEYLGGGGKADVAIEPPENEAGYPDPNMFGVVPAYGLYFRHVKNLQVSDVQMTYVKAEARPPIVLEDVQGATFEDVRTKREPGVAVFRLKDVKDLTVKQVEGVADGRKEATTEESL